MKSPIEALKSATKSVEQHVADEALVVVNATVDALSAKFAEETKRAIKDRVYEKLGLDATTAFDGPKPPDPPIPPEPVGT